MSFRSTFMAFSFVVVSLVVGRPINMPGQVDQKTLLPPDNTEPRPDNDRDEVRSEHDTRPSLTGRDDAIHAEAPPVRLSGGMNSGKDTPFFEDYASANVCGEWAEDFDGMTWKKCLFIFLSTVGILIIVAIVFWAICVCCICDGCDCSYCSEINPKQSIDEPIKIKTKHKKTQTI